MGACLSGFPVYRTTLHGKGDIAVQNSWRRLDEWAKAGVFEQLHLELLDQLGEQGLVGLVAGQRGLGQRWTTWTQIQSIVASLDPSFTLFARAAACR